MMARRRKKRYHPIFFIVPVLFVIALVAGLAALIIGALNSGYDAYVQSTYKLEHYDVVSAACEDFDVEESLVYAIIRTESKFDEEAVSSVGARGLMQMTDTALEWIRFRSDEFDDVTMDDMFDPAINIRCGVYFLSLLEEMFEDENTVIAAYNAGLGTANEWLADSAYSDDGVTLHTIPYEETANYVERVNSSKAIYEEYYQL